MRVGGVERPLESARSRGGIQHALGWELNAKMKVHPGMLMKTKKCRFQVSGAKCQAQRANGWLPNTANPFPSLGFGHRGQIG